MKVLFFYATMSIFYNFALADESTCFQDLTNQPYCLSIAHAEKFCQNMSTFPQFLELAKNCMDERGTTSDAAYACTGMMIETSDPEKRRSNCE